MPSIISGSSWSHFNYQPHHRYTRFQCCPNFVHNFSKQNWDLISVETKMWWGHTPLRIIDFLRLEDPGQYIYFFVFIVLLYFFLWNIILFRKTNIMENLCHFRKILFRSLLNLKWLFGSYSFGSGYLYVQIMWIIYSPSWSRIHVSTANPSFLVLCVQNYMCFSISVFRSSDSTIQNLLAFLLASPLMLLWYFNNRLNFMRWNFGRFVSVFAYLVVELFLFPPYF